jgi:outer membrane immunogenic protein
MSGISVGWTADDGIEYGFARNWTFKAEYLDPGNRSVTFAGQGVAGSALAATSGLTAHIARGGINYRF